jgi:hypothetical protein
MCRAPEGKYIEEVYAGLQISSRSSFNFSQVFGLQFVSLFSAHCTSAAEEKGFLLLVTSLSPAAAAALLL